MATTEHDSGGERCNTVVRGREGRGREGCNRRVTLPNKYQSVCLAAVWLTLSVNTSFAWIHIKAITPRDTNNSFDTQFPHFTVQFTSNRLSRSLPLSLSPLSVTISVAPSSTVRMIMPDIVLLLLWLCLLLLLLLCNHHQRSDNVGRCVQELVFIFLSLRNVFNIFLRSSKNETFLFITDLAVVDTNIGNNNSISISYELCEVKFSVLASKTENQ